METLKDTFFKDSIYCSSSICITKWMVYCYLFLSFHVFQYISKSPLNSEGITNLE